jgi:nucleoside phosphorylase
MSTDTRKYFDLAIIVPLQEEFEIVLDHFGNVEDVSTSDFIRFSTRIKETDVNVLICQQQDMGKSSNASAAISISAEFDVGLFVCLGIAAGLSKDLNIGDVCFSGDILDALDNAKIKQDENGHIDIALSSQRHHTPRAISNSLNLARINPATRPNYESWQAAQYEIGKGLVPGKYPGKEKELEEIEPPKAISGLIVCGMVSSTPLYNAKLTGLERRLHALETESGALFSHAAAVSRPALTVRGICD